MSISLTDTYRNMRRARLPKVPGHMMPVKDWAEREGKGYAHTFKMLKDLCEADVFVMKKYEVALASGLRMLPHYGPKQPPKK